MRRSFCGWYFKCQSDTQTLAIIPAVHRYGRTPSCSIQLIEKDASWNIPLAQNGGYLHPYSPRAALGRSRFSPAGIHLDLHTADCQASGDLSFGPLSSIRFDIMGPFRYVPFLECRHSVASMHHPVSGKLKINQRDYLFSDGSIGYIEGDRGRSFPKQYVWTQCCAPNGSLMLSVAEIPLGPVSFTGVIAVVQTGGKEYRLASYLGAKAARIQAGEIVLRQGNLELSAVLKSHSPRPLYAPVSGKMVRTVRENLACHTHYRLTHGHNLIWELDSEQASFEYESPR